MTLTRIFVLFATTYFYTVSLKVYCIFYVTPSNMNISLQLFYNRFLLLRIHCFLFLSIKQCFVSFLSYLSFLITYFLLLLAFSLSDLFTFLADLELCFPFTMYYMKILLETSLTENIKNCKDKIFYFIFTTKQQLWRGWVLVCLLFFYSVCSILLLF